MDHSYGDKFESATIAIMCAAMIVSLIAVVAMNKAVRHHWCNVSDYTFCGEQPGHH